MSGTTVTTAQRHMPDGGDVHSTLADINLFKKGALQTVLLGIRVIKQHIKGRHQYPHQMQPTHMHKSKANSLKVIPQMTGHLLNHHHTSEVQTKHATPSVSTPPTVDTTMERAFDVVCQLMSSASLPPSDCRRSHCRCCRRLRVDSQQNLLLPKNHRRQIMFAKV